MEMEFDKEIDAILRKARVGESAAVTAAVSPHVDADAIASFAENALPDKAKRLYMEHFADCDRCRQMLSQSILLFSEADATAASSVVTAPVAVKKLSWFERLFRAPNMAMAMGALVLTFSGILGFLMIQRASEPRDTTVAKVSESKPMSGGPGYDPNRTSESSNSAANTSAPMPATNSAPAPVDSSNTASDPDVRPNLKGGGPSPKLDKDDLASGTTPEPVKSAPVGAPPPAPADQPKSEVAEKKADEEKRVTAGDDVVTATRDRGIEDRKDVGNVAKPKRVTGPSRAAGQVQQENNVFNTRIYDGASTKRAGGKSFNQRNGVWYDAAYHGQSTTNVRRGSDDFKKLDVGLRNIANSIGGTVVVVWKEKAYRIQ